MIYGSLYEFSTYYYVYVLERKPEAYMVVKEREIVLVGV